MKPYILIVEDQAILYDGIFAELEKHYFEPSDYIKSYDEAIASIDVRKPDLVLLDINLQGERDGIDLGHILNSKYKIPFIYLTELSDNRVFEMGLQTNHENFIVKAKPLLDVEQLVRAIRTALNKKENQSTEPKSESKDYLMVYADYYENLKEIINEPTEIPIKIKNIALISTREIHFGDKLTLEGVKKNYCRIILNNGDDYFLKSSLIEILNKLPNQFVRISESDIVNILPPTFEGILNDAKISILGIECKISSNFKLDLQSRIRQFYKN